MAKEKLWCECSKAEKDEFNRCNKKWKEATKKYKAGKIDNVTYAIICDLCMLWLDSIEVRYND